MFLKNTYIFNSYKGSTFTFVKLTLNQYHDETRE